MPFPAGGTADIVPRVVGDILSRKWGQPVIIENRTGAGGNIGAEAAFKAEPDGYTLLSAPPPPLVINQNLYPRLNFDPTQFVPIVVMVRVPNSLVVTPKFPARSVAEVIALARANPGKVTSATQGNGTTSHLTSEMFQMMAGVKLQHVPYRGSAPALADLVAGNVDIMFDNLGVSLALVKGGQLRLLAVATPARMSALPEVPTIARRCRVSNRRPGTRWWRRPRRRRRSSTRSMPISTRFCASPRCCPISPNGRARRSAEPRRRPRPICGRRSSAGTR